MYHALACFVPAAVPLFVWPHAFTSVPGAASPLRFDLLICLVPIHSHTNFSAVVDDAYYHDRAAASCLASRMQPASFPTNSELAAAAGSLLPKIHAEMRSVAHLRSRFAHSGVPSWHGQETIGTLWIQNNYAPVMRCESELRIGSESMRISSDNLSISPEVAIDGGKWLCTELLRRQDCTVLSVGIDGNTDFDLGVFRRFGCEIQ